MPGPLPSIHVFRAAVKDVDGRDKPGHDGSGSLQFFAWAGGFSRRSILADSRSFATNSVCALRIM